jgi:hypothetical protein
VASKVAWAYPTRVVQDSPELVALYLQAGAVGWNTEKRPTPPELLRPDLINIIPHTWERTDVLILTVPGDAFSTNLMWTVGTRELLCWYINLQEPIRRTSIGFDTMDHMLDVVVNPDLSEWKWKDEDEFLEAERIGFYSHEQARAIRRAGERAIQLLTSERRAFYQAWEKWQAGSDWEMPRLSPLWDMLDLMVENLRDGG